MPARRGGLVAQWITRLTTDQKIPGSNPGKIEFFNCFFFRTPDKFTFTMLIMFMYDVFLAILVKQGNNMLC